MNRNELKAGGYRSLDNCPVYRCVAGRLVLWHSRNVPSQGDLKTKYVMGGARVNLIIALKRAV